MIQAGCLFTKSQYMCLDVRNTPNEGDPLDSHLEKIPVRCVRRIFECVVRDGSLLRSGRNDHVQLILGEDFVPGGLEPTTRCRHIHEIVQCPSRASAWWWLVQVCHRGHYGLSGVHDKFLASAGIVDIEKVPS